MKIKTKLNLGIGMLLFLLILMAFLSVKQIDKLAKASENIIKDNIETIGYSRSMLQLLTSYETDEHWFVAFEGYLKKQKLNVTESGENELTEKLSEHFQKLHSKPLEKQPIQHLEAILFKIMDLNLQAIDTKNNIAANTAIRSVVLISILSFFSVVIALVLFIKLPSNISNPISELINSIKRIAANDYSQRVNFEGHSELGELATAFNTMATKLNEYDKSNVARLLTEKRINETLINKIQYPIIGFDKQLKVIVVNEEFLNISGLNYNDILGKQILEIANENQLIGQLMLMDNLGNGILSETKTETHIQIEHNGKEAYYEKEIQEIVYTSQNESHRNVLGYFIVLKNVTKYMELDIAKTNFIATVSHELKTPISAIKLSLQLLENEKTGILNNEQTELIKSCEDDTNNLLKIISELLNITQAETGNIQLTILPVDIKEVLNFAIQASKALAEQKQISFKVIIPETISFVNADKDKSIWVLSNLISNAIRYSPENSVIKISVLQNNNQLAISVTDFGPGIEPQYQEKVFDRYFRIPGTMQEGTGLGLAICKEFMVAQGGEIMLESRFGEGSTFTITLNMKSVDLSFLADSVI